MDRGATITLILTSEHYRRSPLVQGGMEIPCKVTASIPGTCINLLLLERYKQLVEECYTEPKNEDILGLFLQVAPEKEIQGPLAAICSKKVVVRRPKKIVGNKDIRSFFGRVPANDGNTKPKKLPKVITID